MTSARRPVQLITGLAGLLVLAVATTTAAIAFKGSRAPTTVFRPAEIQAATHPAASLGAGDEARTIVQKYVARENASGHGIRLEDVNIAVLRSKDRKTTAQLVWSGSRAPTGLLVVSKAGAPGPALAVGLTAATPTGLPTSPLPTPFDRQAYGGAVDDGGLGVVRSDCIDVWVTTRDVPTETLSCAELWHGPQTPEWLYHHFAEGHGSAITTMSVRSRIVKDQRSSVTGPRFVSPCSNGGRTDILAGPVKSGQNTFNPVIRMRSNPCTGYHDLVNQSEWQTGARLGSMNQSDASIETTGAFYVSESSVSPAWEDYAWTQVGCRDGDKSLRCRFGALDESKYLARLW